MFIIDKRKAGLLGQVRLRWTKSENILNRMKEKIEEIESMPQNTFTDKIIRRSPVWFY